MKKLTKIEKKVQALIGYEPRYAQSGSDEYIVKVRARIKKELKSSDEEDINSFLHFLKRKEREQARQARINRKEYLKERRKTLYKSYPEIKKYPKWLRDNIVNNILSYDKFGIYRMSYNTADWGRLRKREYGDVVSYEKVGIRTTDNGKYGWDKVVWHHADYFYTEREDGKVGFYRLTNGEAGFIYRSKSKYMINGRIYNIVTKEQRIKEGRAMTRSIRDNIPTFSKMRVDKDYIFYKNYPPYEYYMHSNLRLRKNFRNEILKAVRKFKKERNAERKMNELTKNIPFISVQRDDKGKLMFVHQEFGHYHIFNKEVAFLKKQVLLAIKAFKKRRDELRRKEDFEKAKEYLFQNANSIFVSLQDSTKAGNCEYGTRRFAEEINVDLSKIGGVSAASILEKRNDNYSLRACIYAAKRVMKIRK